MAEKAQTIGHAMVKVQLASGIAPTTKGAARLYVSLNRKKLRQRFVYLPVLTVTVVRARNFIRWGTIIDVAKEGYRVADQGVSIPFNVRSTVSELHRHQHCP